MLHGNLPASTLRGSRSYVTLCVQLNLISYRESKPKHIMTNSLLKKTLSGTCHSALRRLREGGSHSHVLRSTLCALPLTLALFSGANAAELTSAKAELMGRVEDFFMNNFRDISARKSLEWSEPLAQTNGERSIRYQYEARIWDKKTIIACQTFTFDKAGKFLRFKDAEGYPKDKAAKVVDTSSKKGLTTLVEDFFHGNFRDITSRESIEWGDLEKSSDGNVAIRYKYRAKIWDKDTVVKNQLFTFSPKGEFVSVKDLP